jgi:ABC-type dipeptide/oligopeptide/nickel transport system permease subunit
MVGVIAAYYGGWIDSIIMRIIDIFLAFPGLILAMVFIAIWGQRMEYIMLAYGILGIPYYSRLIRGSVLQARSLPYVEAARVAGAGNWRIMFRHILPNCIQPIIISFTFDVGGIILSLAGLAFLGYSDLNMIEWGRDIDIARGHIVIAPWASLFPGLMILITVLGFMLVGDGLRDALDPRLRNI